MGRISRRNERVYRWILTDWYEMGTSEMLQPLKTANPELLPLSSGTVDPLESSDLAVETPYLVLE